MTTILLVRHGRSTANVAGILAGRSSGVDLDETGRGQAAAAGARLAGLPIAAVVSSPMGRCRQTAALLLSGAGLDLHVTQESGLTECDYGEWTGRALRDLGKEKLWRTVQQTPAAAAFPGGESLAAMSARAVAALDRQDARIRAAHGDQAIWVAVSHGDVIKALLADALGMHLDLFQRIVVNPASISVVRRDDGHRSVLTTNSTEGSLAGLAPARGPRRRRTGAEVGGGLGDGAR